MKPITINLFLLICKLLFLVLLSEMKVLCLRMRIVEDADIVIKFSDKPDLEENMQNLTNKMEIRLKFLKNKANNFNSTSDGVTYYQNSSILNDSLIKIEYIPDEGKFIERQRTLKFYISNEKGCHVDVNDTISYESGSLKSPIEHVIANDHQGYKVSPRGVYSEDVAVQYFGFSQSIKTFSTYFVNKPQNETVPKNNNLTTIEYIYQAKNLINSFSDFRNEASYENITYNYNLISFYLKNENDNLQDVKIKLEYYFDIGPNFEKENTNFTLPMEKSVFQYHKVDQSNPELMQNRTIVKFESVGDLILKYNETLNVQARIPLYFENCKNYKLNFFVVLTGFFFVAFFGFVAYRSIVIIFTEQKD